MESMESAEEMLKNLVPKNPLYPVWPEKQKIKIRTPTDHKKDPAIAVYHQYYEKPKKAAFCAIKRQSEKGKVMSAHLARQI
jgi:hypothetical protein